MCGSKVVWIRVYFPNINWVFFSPLHTRICNGRIHGDSIFYSCNVYVIQLSSSRKLLTLFKSCELQYEYLFSNYKTFEEKKFKLINLSSQQLECLDKVVQCSIIVANFGSKFSCYPFIKSCECLTFEKLSRLEREGNVDYKI